MSSDFEVIQYENGTVSLRERSSGEVMHSKIGPTQEASILYIQQSALTDRLRQRELTGPVVIYDVGLGIAANALAALECRYSMGNDARPLQIHSFENALGGLREALASAGTFPWLEPHRPTLEALLRDRVWESSDHSVRWSLHEGDFFEKLDPSHAPEVIFYDFYAPRAQVALWSVEAFLQVRSLARADTPMDLYTYSAATPVRLALLLAGFFVGYGTPTSAKAETTVASTYLERIAKPLGAEWISKLKRSGRAVPWTAGGASAPDPAAILSRVIEYTQFI